MIVGQVKLCRIQVSVLNIYLSHDLVAQGLSRGLCLRPLSLCLGLERLKLESKAVIIIFIVVILLFIVVLLDVSLL